MVVPLITVLLKSSQMVYGLATSEPADESGTFTPKAGYNGIFFKFSDNTAYIVRDTVLKKHIYGCGNC